MSDIFREVDEDIRHEKYRRLWDRFGSWVIAVAVLIVVGTGGYRGWLYWQDTQSQSAGDTFLEAISLSEAGQYSEAAQLYTQLGSSIGGYPALAQMRQATDKANSGDAAAALAEFDALSRDSSLAPALQNVAALRAAYIAVDSEPYDAIADRIESLTGDTDAFRAAARELLALSAWKNGDAETALAWITALDDDAETPQDIRQRVTLLGGLIRGQTGTPAEEGTAQ
jgi:hypothetical protein